MEIILWEVSNLIIDQKILKSFSKDLKIDKYHFQGDGNHLGKIPLLYDIHGNGITVANNWLIHLKANLHNKYVNSQAQALLHYFIFLNKVKMDWHTMPIPLRLRPTYAFRKYLRDMYKEGKIARTTANNYMNAIINFYKFYLSLNYIFENPPFKYEIIKRSKSNSYEYMRNELIYVDTTDLRLKLPNNTSYYGLSRKLVPLNSLERAALDKYLNFNKVLFSEIDNEKLTFSLSKEFKIAIELALYCGLRRSEIISLRMRAIYKITPEQSSRRYLIGVDGLILDPKLGINTKNGTIRIAEIPCKLMQKLHEYINSSRYIRRRKRYESKYPEDSTNPPLLLTQLGDFYCPKTLDARWGEIRCLIKKEIPNFEHKFHNLRSTYAVERLKELLNSGLKEEKALDYLQSVLGHKNRITLLSYLKFCDDEVTANEIHEMAVNIILTDEDNNGVLKKE